MRTKSFNCGRWSKKEHQIMMRLVTGRKHGELKIINLDSTSIFKVMTFKNFTGAAELLNRSSLQCRTHWQKIKIKLKKVLQMREESTQKNATIESNELARAARLLMDLRSQTVTSW